MRTAWRRYACLPAAALLLLPAPLAPAVIVVGGDCDLVEAIENANADSPTNADCAGGDGADEIQLTADVVLTASDNPTDGDNGLPSITSEITISGAGYSISRDAAALEDFRVLHIESSGNLTLDSVTISGGRLGGATATGGGVFNRGELTLINSTVTGNALEPSTYGNGGGLYNVGTAILETSTISDNTISAEYPYGGGAFNGESATLNLSVSAIVDNAIVGQTGGGAGLESWGIAVLEQSTVAGNTGNVSGGFDPTLWGVGINQEGGSLTLSASTVSGNSGYAADPPTVFDGLALGGGVRSAAGLINISSSTISSNSLTAIGSYAAASGAGLQHQINSGTLSYSTVAGNSVTAAYEGAAGIDTVFGNNLSLLKTLVGHSTGANCAGTLNDVGDNLADDATCSTIPDTLIGLNPLLLDNGGPTRTHSLEDTSNAVDAAGSCGQTTDQRGVLRDDGACDIGAYELNDCLAADGNNFTLEMEMVTGERALEVCATITLGPAVTVVGPDGHLILSAGQQVTFVDGFEVLVDGRLTVEIDPNLNM